MGMDSIHTYMFPVTPYEFTLGARSRCPDTGLIEH